jgi:hypothetical protein
MTYDPQSTGSITQKDLAALLAGKTTYPIDSQSTGSVSQSLAVAALVNGGANPKAPLAGSSTGSVSQRDLAVATASGGKNDNFNRADGGLGSNWAQTTGMAGPVASCAISGNKVVGVTSNHSGAIWVPDPATTDQFSEVVLGATLAVGQFIGPSVRCNADGSAMYAALLFNNSGTTELDIYIESGAVFTKLQGTTVGVRSPGDVVRLTVTGTSLVATLNGVSVTVAADATITSGKPGIILYDTGSLDNWQAG